MRLTARARSPTDARTLAGATPMPGPRIEEVRERLAQVLHPAFERSLIDLDVVAALTVIGATASMKVTIHAASDALRAELRSRIEQALQSIGIRQVDIDWDVQVPVRRVGGDDPVPGVKNVILVMSGKGGVGKSTVATNLALALARSGTRVGLLDADIYGPSLPTMFGISGHPRAKDEKTIEPLQRFGIRLMSIGFMLENERDAIVWRGPMLQGALMQFLSDVDWGELDYLVVDLPPGTGDVALSLAQRLRTTGAVIVTTPQEVALQDVYKSVSMCKKLGIPVLGVIENMSHFIDSAGVKHEIFGAGGGAKVAAHAEAPLIAQIPLDTSVREWGDKGTPVVQAAPDRPAARAFAEAAEVLASRIALESFVRGGSAKAPDKQGPKRLKIVR